MQVLTAAATAAIQSQRVRGMASGSGNGAVDAVGKTRDGRIARAGELLRAAAERLSTGALGTGRSTTTAGGAPDTLAGLSGVALASEALSTGRAGGIAASRRYDAA